MMKLTEKQIKPGFRNRLRDTRESLRRFFPGPLKGVDKYGLGVTQVYPEGENFYTALEMATCERFRDLEITADTPVASIGTCFAEEFAGFMKNAGGHYLLVEDNVFNASANWGRVYTIPNLRQIIEYSVTDIPATVVESDGKFIDPTREKSIGYFQTREEALEKIAIHRALSSQVFKTAKVLVITLGQNEAWEEGETGLVWGTIPPGDLRKTQGERFRPVMFDYATCRTQLKEAITLLRSVNPELQIILTVSPVAAYATFTSNDVITQSMEGKCMLRTIAGEISRELKEIYYFPSFEMVLCRNPYTFNADNRHVKRGTVARIFTLLSNAIR